jgi:hypothetical protein
VAGAEGTSDPVDCTGDGAQVPPTGTGAASAWTLPGSSKLVHAVGTGIAAPDVPQPTTTLTAHPTPLGAPQVHGEHPRVSVAAP